MKKKLTAFILLLMMFGMCSCQKGESLKESSCVSSVVEEDHFQFSFDYDL